MGAKYFGAAVLRREDPRFLRGEGRFVDDVTLPGLLQAAFLRSPHAHARIVAIRTERAKKMPGVVAVFTHADLARWMKPLPLFGAPPPGLAAAVKFDIRQAPQYALATQRVRHVGEIVAMVVADDRGRPRWTCSPPARPARRWCTPTGAPTSPSASATPSVTPGARSRGPTSCSRRRSASSATSACRSRAAAWWPRGTGATGRSRRGTARRSRTSSSRGW